MKKNIILISIVGVLLVVVSTVLWQNRSTPVPKYTGPVEKINLGGATQLLSALVWVAENKGYFQENGVEVNIKEFDSGQAALAAMLNGSDLDMVTSAQTPIVFNSFKSSNFSIVAGMVSSYNDTFVLARTDRSITKPADLLGKKIGLTMGSASQYFLDLVLNNNNLQLSDLETVNLPANQLAQSIATGAVDAIISWQPNVYNAQKALGGKSITFPNNKIFRLDFYFVSNRQFLQNHPEAVVRFLKAIKQAEDFTQNNKDEAIVIFSQRLGLDKDFVFSVWDNYQFGLFLDQTAIQIMESEARWAIKNKLTDKTQVPNYMDYIYFDALETVKTEAVTIVH